MIELSKTIIAENGVIVPAGTRLEFRNGKAKYQSGTILRKLVPLQAIKYAKGPFLNAVVATIFNVIVEFQKTVGKKFQDWAHVIVFNGKAIVYIWDTREVIDVISVNDNIRGTKQIRTLKSKVTGQRIEQFLGETKYGWSKTFYSLLMNPKFSRPDNGLPLITDNKDWKPIVDELNAIVKQKYAFENTVVTFSRAKPDISQFVGIEEKPGSELTDDERSELAKIGQAMPDGSYPIRNIDDLKNAIQSIGRAKDYDAVKQFIIKRANELNATNELPESWNASPAVEAKNVIHFEKPIAGLYRTYDPFNKIVTYIKCEVLAETEKQYQIKLLEKPYGTSRKRGDVIWTRKSSNTVKFNKPSSAQASKYDDWLREH